MKTYAKPEEELLQQVESVKAAYHKRLCEAGVTIDVLMAYGSRDADGQITAPAIAVGGYQAMASIRITNLRERTKGNGDAEMLIDADNWFDLDERTQAAVIDHELVHLDLTLDKNGMVATDDMDRPKMSLKKHSRQYGWFDEVVQRHGEYCLESQQCRAFLDGTYKQLWFPGLE